MIDRYELTTMFLGEDTLKKFVSEFESSQMAM